MSNQDEGKNENVVTAILYAMTMSCIAAGMSESVESGKNRVLASGLAWLLYCSLYVFGDLLMLKRPSNKGSSSDEQLDDARITLQLLLNLLAWVMFAVHGLFLRTKSVSILVYSAVIGLVCASVSVFMTDSRVLRNNGKWILFAENVLFAIFILFVECDNIPLVLKDICRSWWFLLEIVTFFTMLVINLCFSTSSEWVNVWRWIKSRFNKIR